MEQLILSVAIALVNQIQAPSDPTATGERLHVGMPKDNLIAALGKPNGIDQDRPEAIFLFNKNDFKAEATLPCMVYVEGGKVTRFRHCKPEITNDI